MDYMASLKDEHVTSSQIIRHFKNGDTQIGRTTVFRLLDKLTESGEIRRYAIEGISGAYYQFNGKRDDCHTHLHLKCENCGELLHLECDELNKLRSHMLDEHAFELNTMKTVLYGQCESCALSRAAAKALAN